MTGKSIENEFFYMFGNNKQFGLNKKWALAGLMMGLLSLVLLIEAHFELIPIYQNESLVGTLVWGGIITFLVAPFIGFLLSLVGLVKAFRKPNVYGGKIIALTALLINTAFALFVTAGIIWICFLMLIFSDLDCTSH